jgi:hypothetical protein
MIVRKTLEQAKAEGGYIDREKFDWCRYWSRATSGASSA